MPDKAAGLTLLQRVVMWILHAVMFYVVALYPIYLMARFEPDDVVHYGFLRWIAVALILYWAALHLFFTERPSESRVGRMFLAVTAAIVLIIGTFSPIVSFSFIGEIDYFRGGYGDGYILIIMAGLALALAVTGRWKQVLVPALGSLAAILWTFLGVQDTITQARSGDAAPPDGPDGPDEFQFAGKRLDFREQILHWDGTQQPLTLMEATLLRYLVRREGQTVPRKALLEEVWGVREDTDTRTVDNFIARLRRYLEAEPAHPKHLQTVRGVGYRFVAEPGQAAAGGAAGT